MKALVTQSYPNLCNPMDCSSPGSSIHGILQARILEWFAISFSRGSSRPRYQTWVSCIPGRFFTIWTTREAPLLVLKSILYFLIRHNTGKYQSNQKMVRRKLNVTNYVLISVKDSSGRQSQQLSWDALYLPSDLLSIQMPTHLALK